MKATAATQTIVAGAAMVVLGRSGYQITTTVVAVAAVNAEVWPWVYVAITPVAVRADTAPEVSLMIRADFL